MPDEFRASVYIATSLDGFIARADGSLDWLDAPTAQYDPDDDLGDLGFAEFLATVDVLVMGRSTYDTVLGFGEWPYGDTPVAVATHRSIDPPPASADADVHAVAGTATEIAAALAAEGHRRAYVDGGTVINQFLAAGLVDRLVLTRIPVLIGSGIALFGELPHDIGLRHEGTTSWSNGLVQSTYRVVSSGP